MLHSMTTMLGAGVTQTLAGGLITTIGAVGVGMIVWVNARGRG